MEAVRPRIAKLKLGFRSTRRLFVVLVLAGFEVCSEAKAQLCTTNLGWLPGENGPNLTGNCAVFRCYAPNTGAPTVTVDPPSCDPNVSVCAVTATLPVVFPGVHACQGGGCWQPSVPADIFVDDLTGGVQVGMCGSGGVQLTASNGVAKWSFSGSCSSPPHIFRVTVGQCDTPPGWTGSCPSCGLCYKQSFQVALHPAATGLCREPPPPPCKDNCRACIAAAGGGAPPPTDAGAPGKGGGGGCGASVGGGGASVCPGAGPGASLRYFAGGVGHPGFPGSDVWPITLGRYWSHEWAERIVQDPGVTHVWLLTREGGYEEFTDTVPGGDGLYELAAPSDEYRQLFKTAGGWELRWLDGTVQAFGPTGVWLSTTDRFGNATVATYNSLGQLQTVSFPDGRADTFTYIEGGKLRTIRRRAVDGTLEAPWTYDWSSQQSPTLLGSGPDLIRVTRPDGTKLEFSYADARFPGYMTLMELVTAAGARRVLAGYEYDASGNVVTTWAGDTTVAGDGRHLPGPAAVSTYHLAFDNAANPTVTTVTDPLLGTSVYSLGRDPQSRKPRISSIQGACPTCGSAPNSTFQYDPAHPMRVSMETNPRGVRTDFTYDSHGQLVTKVEAATESGHPHLPRETTWTWDSTYPALLQSKTGPVRVGETTPRVQTWLYNSGRLEESIREGVESPNGPFSLSTLYTGYNAAGRPGAIDPPGFGTGDQTTFTYDVPGPDRHGLLVRTESNAAQGTTTYGYDVFNRRTSVTDPNGAITETSYDTLNRVMSVIQRGDPGTATDDRTTTYTYNAFGDLYCVKSPSGGGTEYLYDVAGRLQETRRGTAVPSPTATSCLSISSASKAERQFYVLDAAGHRTSESLERGSSPTTWEVHASTSFDYGSMCHLDKVTRGPGSINSVTEYAYDCAGNLSKVWDPNHPRASYPAQPSIVYDYDPLNRLLRTAEPWSGSGGGEVEVGYTYDVQDHLVAVRDQQGSETQFEYSDRDLMTAQSSPVTNGTTYSYNEHGDLLTETNALGVEVTHSYDAAGRPSGVGYPNSALNVSFTYGSAPGLFNLGRLTSVARGTRTVAYTYNAFGQVRQDGDLEFSYDTVGNLWKVSYPGGDLVATYGRDVFGRETSLTIQDSGGPATTIVGSSPGATYRAFGPLESLVLGTTPSRTETRAYDERYAPWTISVSGGLFDWTYTTDTAGDVTAIDDGTPANQDRLFDYLPWQRFLWRAQGPWGSLSWEYDRMGNRVLESRSRAGAGEQLSYFYSGTTPILQQVQPFPNPEELSNYDFDHAGYLVRIQRPLSSIPATAFTFDDAGLLRNLDGALRGGLGFEYDGRGFLAQARISSSGDSVVTTTYDSQGRLFAKNERGLRQNVLYFAGRPVAQWSKLGATPATLMYLVTDHLGTPAMALNADSTVRWSGGFDPFGGDWQRGTPQNALGSGLFLRLPGQWDDTYLHRQPDTSTGTAAVPLEGKEEPIVYYNVHRWYEPGTGRYVSADPAGLSASTNLFSYVGARPNSLTDPLGLLSVDDSCLRFRDRAYTGGYSDQQCCASAIEEGVKQYNEFFAPGWRERHPRCWKALSSAGMNKRWGLGMNPNTRLLAPWLCMSVGHSSAVVECDKMKQDKVCAYTNPGNGNPMLTPSVCTGCGSPFQQIFHEMAHNCGAPMDPYESEGLAYDVGRACTEP